MTVSMMTEMQIQKKKTMKFPNKIHNNLEKKKKKYLNNKKMK